jgi:hypothetical protein
MKGMEAAIVENKAQRFFNNIILIIHIKLFLLA